MSSSRLRPAAEKSVEEENKARGEKKTTMHELHFMGALLPLAFTSATASRRLSSRLNWFVMFFLMCAEEKGK